MLEYSLSLMQVVRRFVLLLVLTVASGMAPAQSTDSAPPESAKPPNIILITLDTTRADRMGFLGSKRGLTPNLDALALRSVVFTRAYAQVPLTSPSHAALLTGTYPQFNGVRDLAEPLRSDVPYVPDLLHQHGYHTAAFLGAMILDPASGAAPGFDRGFDVYDSPFHNPAPGEDRYHSLERRAEEVANQGMGWLSHNREGPFFLWLHFFDPHDPYDPPEPFKTRFATNPYDGEIAYADAVVGSVMEVLQRHGLFEDTLIAIAADHGEAFGEHRERRHGLLLYDETIHVPLLLKLPQEKFAGAEIGARVALADIAPSLLEAAGVPVPASVQAQSLFPLIEAPRPAPGEKSKLPDRPIYSETDYAHRTFGWSELHSWRQSKYLYIQAPAKELYDESLDPKEIHNLAPAAKAVAGALDAQLSDFRKKTSVGHPSQVKLDPTQTGSLQALGYLATESAESKDTTRDSVNPKDKVEEINQLQDALFDIEEGRYSAGLQKASVAFRDPDAVNAYLELGIALAHHEQYKDGLPLLETAAKKLPKSVVAQYELAKALANTKQWQAALPPMRAASDLKPESARLHFFVAAVLGHLNRVPDAIAEYEKALKIDPNFFEANLTYGRLLLQLGHPDEALPKLTRAVESKPQAPEAHIFLAEAYEKLGQAQNASEERAKANQLRSQPQP